MDRRVDIAIRFVVGLALAAAAALLVIRIANAVRIIASGGA